MESNSDMKKHDLFVVFCNRWYGRGKTLSQAMEASNVHGQVFRFFYFKAINEDVEVWVENDTVYPKNKDEADLIYRSEWIGGYACCKCQEDLRGADRLCDRCIDN